MGRDKALLPIGGRTFLEHLASVLDGEVAPLIVVLGHHSEQIEKQVHLPPGTWILRNPSYHLGQLSSLHVALRSLAEQRVDAALVCLVDHPAVTKPVVKALLSRFEQSRSAILVPSWQGRRGHPVLFASGLFGELLAAPLDQGARVVIRRHAEQVEYLDVDEEGIVWDVDRPEDYAALQSRWTRSDGLSRADSPPPAEQS